MMIGEVVRKDKNHGRYRIIGLPTFFRVVRILRGLVSLVMIWVVFREDMKHGGGHQPWVTNTYYRVANLSWSS